MKQRLVGREESFVFEAVFSDPVGDKVAFLPEAAQCGYVVLCYIGLSGLDQSAERVEMRVSQGGQDVPDDKLQARLPRTLANLRAAIARLPHVALSDNSSETVARWPGSNWLGGVRAPRPTNDILQPWERRRPGR
jgi:predicted ABC-type ATPase